MKEFKLKIRDSEAEKYFFFVNLLRDEKGVRENKGSVRQETPGIQEKQQHAKGNVIKK